MKLSLHQRIVISAPIVQAAAVAAADHSLERHGKKKRQGTRFQKAARRRVRRTVADIYECLGPIYFHRAYRMSYSSFWSLHAKLEPVMIAVATRVRG